MLGCRVLFGKLKILPTASHYIFALMLFVVKNNDLFILNSDKYNSGTRLSNNLYQPTAKFSVYQRGVYCMGIRVFNNLPSYIKDLSHNPSNFEACIKHFLSTHYFYSIDEYFQFKAIVN
jgi:hypothetical protein